MHESTLTRADPLPRVLLTIAGLAVLGSLIVTAAAAMARPEWRTLAEVGGMAALWGIAAATLVTWRRRDSLAGIGWRKTGGKDVLIAVGWGFGLMLAVPLLAWLATAVAGADLQLVETASARPAWIVALGVLTAAVTEEVIYRGAAMGALRRAGAAKFWQLVIPAILFTAIHFSWTITHTVFVVLPLGLALGALYLWRRNLLMVIVAHLIVDIPLVVLALAGTP